MKFIEMFAGIGGFRVALEQAGHQGIWANEILLNPRRIYRRNWNEWPDGRDVRIIPEGEFPDHELLTGGFPCATFSIAGKRTGLAEVDTRGTLFFEICRVLRAKRPNYLLLENVRGLTNHDGGRTLAVILARLDELGYDAQWEVLNSKNFGVPQNRERIFIVGNFRGCRRPKVFPLGREAGADSEMELSGEPVVGCIRAADGTDSLHGGSQLIRRSEPGEEPGKIRVLGNLKTEGPAYKLSWDYYSIRGIAPTLCGSIFVKDDREVELPKDALTDLRRLTPLEFERLQGLPEGYTALYEDGTPVPNRERYERCGRTVTIPVVREIGRRLFDFY